MFGTQFAGTSCRVSPTGLKSVPVSICGTLFAPEKRKVSFTPRVIEHSDMFDDRLPNAVRGWAWLLGTKFADPNIYLSSD